LDRAREDFEASGVALQLIGQATPRHAAHFRRRHGLELPILADERRESYKAAGAKVGSVGELLGPGVIAKGILTTARTRKVQGRVIGNAAQLGGAMLVAPDGTIAWTHMAKDAADNASPAELLAAVRRLG
jgi:prostamide/prostaglandin F2alpha synthase